jgi:hypothetical protein
MPVVSVNLAIEDSIAFFSTVLPQNVNFRVTSLLSANAVTVREKQSTIARRTDSRRLNM